MTTAAHDPDALSASYDFTIPPAAIAQHPVPRRDGSRLMVVRRNSEEPEHRRFESVADLLEPGDLLVVNDARVLPARLFARRPGGGRSELLLLRPLGDGSWAALVRRSARIPAGTELTLLRRTTGEEGPRLRVEEALEEGRRVRRADGGDPAELLEAWGEMPLPPYIERPDAPAPEDRTRYQTVYAREPGAVAAPTAGLHFSSELLERLEARGVLRASITLFVGAGTFQPLRVDELAAHPMHAERYLVPPETVAAIEACEARGGRLVVVGTTACRALESWHRLGRPSDGMPRATRLFLRPGDPPRLDFALITNFHLPQSTLVVLVASILGRERTLSLYGAAIDAGYRFYSYGDAMLLL